MGYTKIETLNKLKTEISKIDTLYKADCVKRIGTTKDTNEFYTEVISGQLLRDLKEFDKIKTVTRSSTYCRANHTTISIDLKSPRKEEIFAKRIAYLDLGELGVIKDYQIPLKDTKADKGLGAIDLMSFNHETNTLYLIELKYEGNREALLRAALEGYTYFRIIDTEKLIEDYKKSQTVSSVDFDNINVVPAVLVTPGCKAYDELNEMADVGKERPKLKSLSLALGIRYFTLKILVDESIL